MMTTTFDDGTKVGTICFGAILHSGHMLLCADSRSSFVLPGKEGVYSIEDLHSKVQRVGNCIVLICGNSLLAYIVLNRVRIKSKELNNDHVDLESFMLKENILYLKSSPRYVNHLRKFRNSDTAYFAFIVGSTIVNRNVRFRDQTLGTINSEFEIRYSRAISRGEWRAKRVIDEEIVNSPNFLSCGVDDATHMLIVAMTKACEASPVVCGGPIEYLTIFPELVGSDDDMELVDSDIIFLDQSHHLDVPEVYFAQHNIDFPGNCGQLLKVPTAILHKPGIDPATRIFQIKEYSHEVGIMYSSRYYVDSDGRHNTAAGDLRVVGFLVTLHEFLLR